MYSMPVNNRVVDEKPKQGSPRFLSKDALFRKGRSARKHIEEETVLKNILLVLSSVAFAAMMITGCGLLGGEEQPPPPELAAAPAAPVAAPAPVAPVVAAPPRTDLIPVVQEEAEVDTSAQKTPSKNPGKKAGDDVDKEIKGPAIEGDELLGNYTCTITSSEFPMGLNPPPSGCRIFRGAEGNLRIGPTNRGLGLQGQITDPKEAGFHVNGSYNIGIGKFKVKARMLKKGEGNYKGNGNGYLNDNKDNKMKYQLTIAK